MITTENSSIRSEREIEDDARIALNHIVNVFNSCSFPPCCFERERCVPTIHGDNYRKVTNDPVYRLDNPESRLAWQAAAREKSDRIIPEDGAKYVNALEMFVVEPVIEQLMADLMPQKIEHETGKAGISKRIREEYKAGKAELMENSKLLAREKYRERLIRIKWAKLNRAIGCALEEHPEGLTWYELYAELNCDGAANVSPSTFRQYLKDNRCEYEVEKAGPFNVVAKSL